MLVVVVSEVVVEAAGIVELLVVEEVEIVLDVLTEVGTELVASSESQTPLPLLSRQQPSPKRIYGGLQTTSCWRQAGITAIRINARSNLFILLSLKSLPINMLSWRGHDYLNTMSFETLAFSFRSSPCLLTWIGST